ncbi:MAG: DUF5666 domain-containing protein [Gammaproteobacteria bacterium]|nr:DUF5666 domain-containing protein [Gammaproteobacteria bacterium]
MSIQCTYKKMLAVVFSISLMTSCGPEAPLLVNGGIGGTGISSGAITAFGSVYVNGVHYDTDHLDQGVWIDGQRSTYDQLKVGMVLHVHGSINTDGLTGSASGLEYKSLAKGPAHSFNDNMDETGDFVILGQTIQVIANTAFYDIRTGGTIIDMATLAAVSDNSLYLEISGYQSWNNTIYARRIEVKRAWVNGTSVRLMGTVDSVNSGSSFTIGSQIIAYDSASDDLNGKYVEVEGTYIGTIFSADVVNEEELGVNGTDGEEFELEGVVTSIPDVDSIFTLNGQKVKVIGGTTEFEPNTNDINSLTAGTEVEAKGKFDANGILIADTIEFDDEVNELDGVGMIASVDPDTKTLTFSIGTVVILTVNNDTEIRDHRDTGMDQFTFADFSSDMNLKFKYYEDVNGNNIATRIDIEDP